jgi:hypothetical protein
MSDPAEVNDLMSRDEYEKFLREESEK